MCLFIQSRNNNESGMKMKMEETINNIKITHSYIFICLFVCWLVYVGLYRIEQRIRPKIIMIYHSIHTISKIIKKIQTRWVELNWCIFPISLPIGTTISLYTHTTLHSRNNNNNNNNKKTKLISWWKRRITFPIHNSMDT